MRAIAAAKRLVRPLRNTRLAHGIGDRALRNEYRWGKPNGPVSRSLHWVTLNDMADVKSRARSVGALVELFFDLVETLHVRRFVEAGAKEATASRRASEVAGIEHVVAFEANPYTFRRFSPGFERSSVAYEHLALVDGPDPQVAFNVKRTPDGGPRADGQGSLLTRADYSPGYEQVVVPAVNLDHHLGTPDGVPTALWVDVEGATAAVLRGGVNTLDDTYVALVEVEDRFFWTGQEWLRRDVIEALGRHGLVPVARDRQSRFQFNIVFVRSEFYGRPALDRALRRWMETC